MLWFKDSPNSTLNEGCSLKAENVIMCCLIRTIAHLRAWSNGGMMISRENPKKLGRKRTQ
jgi:hypothetical protein